jgi:hypothetical protein
MAKGRLSTDNPELLVYTEGKLHMAVLGGIKLTGLDRLRVTLKLTISGKPNKAYRHNLDLYNGIGCGQLAERAAEVLDVSESKLN